MTADWQHRRAKRKGSTSWRGSGQRAGLWGKEVLIRGYDTWVLQKVLNLKFSIFIFNEKPHLVCSQCFWITLSHHTVARARVYSFVLVKIEPTEVAVHCLNIWGWRLRVLDSVYNSDYVTTSLLLKGNSQRTSFDAEDVRFNASVCLNCAFLCSDGLRLKKKSFKTVIVFKLNFKVHYLCVLACFKPTASIVLISH